jgi:hypothetical protein
VLEYIDQEYFHRNGTVCSWHSNKGRDARVGSIQELPHDTIVGKAKR